MIRVQSIRQQLLLWILIPSILLWGVALLSVWFFASRLAEDAYDDGLSDSAEALASLVRFRGNQVIFRAPPEASKLFSMRGADHLEFSVSDTHGNRLAGDGNFPPPNGIEPHFGDRRVNNVNIRFYVLPVLRPDTRLLGAWVQVAESRNGRDQLMRESVLETAVPFLIMVFLSAGAVWVGVSRGLSSLDRLRSAVAHQSAKTLSPIPLKDVPREVRQLVATLNHLIGGVSSIIASQHRFIERAAHQLRTPVAGLQILVERAFRESNPANFKQVAMHIQSSVERVSHLLIQLLSLARAEPGISQNLQVCDLTRLVREICGEHAPAALQKRLALTFDSPNASILIRAVPQNIHDSVTNLLDNAIAYTSERGSVQVVLQCEPLRLTVSDSGPGIPPSEQSQIFERFYRMPGSLGSGSGLGLSIVKEGVERLGGFINIVSPGVLGGSDFLVNLPPECRVSQSMVPEVQATDSERKAA